MANYGDLLSEAMAETLSRGKVFWVLNDVWPKFYGRADSRTHPCLVCFRTSVFAPGTRKESAESWEAQQPFSLSRPEELNGERSTFMLKMKRKVSRLKIGDFMGKIHPDDLHALNQVLGQEKEN